MKIRRNIGILSGKSIRGMKIRRNIRIAIAQKYSNDIFEHARMKIYYSKYSKGYRMYVGYMK